MAECLISTYRGECRCTGTRKHKRCNSHVPGWCLRSKVEIFNFLILSSSHNHCFYTSYTLFCGNMATSLARRVLPARVANTGSQQRDHHANERTFLSWTRAGLGFAAMALALDRLDAIDRLLQSKLGLSSPGPLQLEALPANANKEPETAPAPKSTTELLMNNCSATRVCELLGVWCLGYGFFRYWSMRRYLMIGQFVPAFWGPVFMTAGSFGAFMAFGLQMDRRHASS